MDQDELLLHLRGIHGVAIEDVHDIDPAMVRIFIDNEDERVAANAVFLARLFPSEVARPMFVAALQSKRESIVVAAAAYAKHLTDADAEEVLKTVFNTSTNPSVLRAAFRSANQLHLEGLRTEMQSAMERLPEGAFSEAAKAQLDSL